MKAIHTTLPALAAAVLVASGLLYVACSDDSTVNDNPAGTDGGTSSGSQGSTSGTVVNPDGGTLPDGAPADCVDITGNPNPSYLDIINACTTATRIQKAGSLTKLLSDGGLPPLN
jgi:hypothetical protein